MNGITELLLKNRDDRIRQLQDEKHALLVAAQVAYTILADVRHEWDGRNTEEGQGALIALRESIAKATGRDPQDVQDEFSNVRAVAALR